MGFILTLVFSCVQIKRELKLQVNPLFLAIFLPLTLATLATLDHAKQFLVSLGDERGYVHGVSH